MSQIITAVVDNGMLKPDEPLDLPPQTRVRLLIVDPMRTKKPGKNWSSYGMR
jgi:predicted DNA-binding antitoxin AbrB/MazE fold protein